MSIVNCKLRLEIVRGSPHFTTVITFAIFLLLLARLARLEVQKVLS